MLSALTAVLLASAQIVAPTARLATDLNWTEKPSGDDMAAVIPADARDAKVGGWAMLECRFASQGRFQSCVVLGEAPAGRGFGAAAVKLAPKFRAPITKAGQPTDGLYARLPIIFTLNGAAPPPLDFMAGEPAAIVTMGTEPVAGDFPCPTTDMPARRCRMHAFKWAVRPSLEESAATVRSAGATSGRSTLQCRVKGDYRLEACASAEPDAARKTAMLDIAKTLTAPILAADKTPTAGARVVIDFNWSALRGAIDASAFTKQP